MRAVEPANQTTALSLIPDANRRAHVGKIFDLWRAMRLVWRPATTPDATDVDAYDQNRRALHNLIVDPGLLGGYIGVPNYVHMMIEHVVDKDHPIGKWGT